MRLRAALALQLLLCLCEPVGSTNADWWHGEELKVQAWTWNSAKEDLSKEARRLSSSDADVLVLCQTEAKTGIRHHMDETAWTLISHGEHYGVAGGTTSKQAMSIFLNQRRVKLATTVPPEEEWKQKAKALGIWFNKDKVMATASVPDVVEVTTMLHQTSQSGKGGLSADLRWAATKDRQASRTAVLCAHLDSEDEEKRSQQLAQMFSEMRTTDAEWQEELRAKPYEIWQEPQEAFVPSAEVCPADRLELEVRRLRGRESTEPPVDMVLLVGDLNYRLRPYGKKIGFMSQKSITWADSKALAYKISNEEGRRTMGEWDPLRDDVWVFSTNLVRSAQEQGLGFLCNQPYSLYPPTYKLVDAEACARMGQAMADGESEVLEDLVMQCYGKLSKADNRWHLKVKKEGEPPVLQLGWLDRVCYRSAAGSELQVSFLADDGWMDTVPYPDHMPVAVTLGLKHPRHFKCLRSEWEHLLPARTTIKEQDGKDVTCLPPSMPAVLSCEDDLVFDVSYVPSLRVRCDEVTGALAVVDEEHPSHAEAPVSSLKCVKATTSTSHTTSTQSPTTSKGGVPVVPGTDDHGDEPSGHDDGDDEDDDEGGVPVVPGTDDHGDEPSGHDDGDDDDDDEDDDDDGHHEGDGDDDGHDEGDEEDGEKPVEGSFGLVGALLVLTVGGIGAGCYFRHQSILDAVDAQGSSGSSRRSRAFEDQEAAGVEMNTRASSSH